ncbi:hypothetical protein BRC82_10725 [Halobacteriales archaeon QS_1_67_19]|nr:MAG: hypothetical protein BRC82_10725 [Halobacteriales archaeon QS_1_67_19]
MLRPRFVLRIADLDSFFDLMFSFRAVLANVVAILEQFLPIVFGLDCDFLYFGSLDEIREVPNGRVPPIFVFFH